MTNTSKPIVFFGTEDFSVTALIGLIESGYTIAAVITKPDSKKGRGHHLTLPPVKIIAEKHNIPVWQPKSLHEIISNIKTLGEPIGVLVSFGKIIPQSIINLFQPGIINVHPSLLPKYRGPSPIESAIRNGDQETGVSIMQLVKAMDAGPIYAIKHHTLSGKENRIELYHALADIGTNLLLETLPHIIDGSLQPTPQNNDQASYCDLLQKSDAFLDLTQFTALEAERRIRAFSGFPKSKVTINNHEVIITKAHITASKNSALELECKDGKYLSIDELTAPSGKTLTANAFINGYLH
jgi:methionyl-tRNA formyltransferase